MNLSAFFSYTFLTVYTPGPNNIMSLRIQRETTSTKAKQKRNNYYSAL
jgi:hypothetical protein